MNSSSRRVRGGGELRRLDIRRAARGVLVAVALCALGAVFAADAYAVPELTVLGKEPVEVKAGAPDAYVTVLNTGSSEATANVSLQASDLKPPEAVKASLAQPVKIKPNEAVRLDVKLTGLSTLKETATGQLVVTDGVKPVSQSVTIESAPNPWTDWPPTIIGFSLGLAAFLMLTVASRVTDLEEGRKLLKGPAPGPKWSFESWASQLTAVGALLGGVVAAVTLPTAAVQIDKETAVELSALFAGLATAAPFVFQALRAPKLRAQKVEPNQRAPKVDAAKEEERDWGFTWGLLLACWMVLAGVLGELATLGLIAWVITGGGVGGVALEIGLGILVLLAGYYVWTTTYSLASTDWKAVAELAKSEAVAKAKTGRDVHLRRAIAAESGRASRHVDIGTEAQAYRVTLRLP